MLAACGGAHGNHGPPQALGLFVAFLASGGAAFITAFGNRTWMWYADAALAALAAAVNLPIREPATV